MNIKRKPITAASRGASGAAAIAKKDAEMAIYLAQQGETDCELEINIKLDNDRYWTVFNRMLKEADVYYTIESNDAEYLEGTGLNYYYLRIWTRDSADDLFAPNAEKYAPRW